MNILVADDEKVILSGIKEFLTEQGYRVYAAKDGKEALEIYRENAIDLLILDVMMPNMTGFEVLNEIRQESNVPVIILSALEDEISQLKGF